MPNRKPRQTFVLAHLNFSSACSVSTMNNVIFEDRYHTRTRASDRVLHQGYHHQLGFGAVRDVMVGIKDKI